MSTDTPRIIVAVDGTHRSTGAVNYAVEEARSQGAGLTVVHVTPTYTPMSPMLPLVPMVDTMPALVEAESQRLLATVAAKIAEDAPDLQVQQALMRGSRSAAIVQAARGAALLVVGCETRTGLERVTTGTTTAKVAAHARCPVVVVPSDWQRGAVKHRLVVGIKSTAHASAVLAQAFELAATRKDSLLVVHAWKLPDAYLDRIEARTNLAEWIERGERLLEDVLAEWRQAYPEVEVETRVRHMHTVPALLEAAREADLLLVPRHAHGPVHLVQLGGTARALLRHATTPVEVLPARHEPELHLGLELEGSGRLLR